MRTFVLVTATVSTVASPDKIGSGIRKLKRGVKLEEFITSYIEELKISDVELLKRGETLMLINRADKCISTWAFTEYNEDALLEAVSHLTKDELLRDLKELLPLKDNWS